MFSQFDNLPFATNGRKFYLSWSHYLRLHTGEIDIEIDRGKSYRDAAQMNTMRKAVYREMAAVFGEDKVKTTYGYITKYNRKLSGLVKTHIADAHNGETVVLLSKMMKNSEKRQKQRL